MTSDQDQKDNLLIQIKSLIAGTDQRGWRKGGSALSTKERFEKPRDTWERVYTIDVPGGVLVMRCALPIKSEFLGAGYTYSPSGKARYTVELRGVGFRPRELTDPFRTTRIADRRCDVLADGEAALLVFEHVEQYFRAFEQASVKQFEDEVAKLLTTLPSRVKEIRYDKWDTTNELDGTIRYRSEFDGIEVEISKEDLQGIQRYSLKFTKDDLLIDKADRSVAKELFNSISDMGKTAGLMALTKVLEGVKKDKPK